MKKVGLVFVMIFFIIGINYSQSRFADTHDYLGPIKEELIKEWPKNRTVNLVFHGHSVPAGYFKTPVVNTLDSYSYQLLEKLKTQYPYAVINVINTAIGGENSASGAKRFKADVLSHQPDVLFIDYSLNDRRIGLDEAYDSWEKMIKKALKKGIKIILLSPSPDQRVDISEDHSILDQHGNQVKRLAEENGLGFVDSYELFKSKVIAGDSLIKYMSQVNHPNKAGHKLIADELLKYFK